MRILLDECVDFAVCAFLRDRGFEATHVKETTWTGTSNSRLYEEARTAFNLFITSDRDFRNPAKYPPTPTMGVMYLRIVPPVAKAIIPALERFLQEVPLETITGKYAVVRRDGFDVR